MKTKALKVIQVCKPEECNNNLFEAQVKGKSLTFCCQKGFETSIEDFTINEAAKNYAKEILGEQQCVYDSLQFKHNKNAVQSIVGDFEAGAKYFRGNSKDKFEKAKKWDNLDSEIGKFYEVDDKGKDIEDGDLGDIGEKAAMAFGYL